MQSAWKIFVFFFLCIVLGLGIGAGVASGIFQKSLQQNKSVLAMNHSEATIETTSQPVQIIAENADPILQPSMPQTSATELSPSTSSSPKPFSCPKPENPSQISLEFEPVGPNDYIGNYIPSDLVQLDKYVPTTTTSICLEKDAAIALAAMFSAMHKEGLNPMITSGFRDMNYQEYLYEGTNTVTNGYSSVALAGHSEHQLGVAVDFIGILDNTNADYAALNDFGKTADYAWLVQNAASYGFVQSYQVGKESITGYIPEPWHWRYVGIKNAQAIVSSGLAPVQFLENLKMKN